MDAPLIADQTSVAAALDADTPTLVSSDGREGSPKHATLQQHFQENFGFEQVASKLESSSLCTQFNCGAHNIAVHSPQPSMEPQPITEPSLTHQGNNLG